MIDYQEMQSGQMAFQDVLRERANKEVMEERMRCINACKSVIDVIRDEISAESRPVHIQALSSQIHAIKTALFPNREP